MKKRILAFILIIAMLAALGLNAGAAGTGTISIQNMNDGESYTVYKVFDVEYNETTGAYRYVLPATGFEDFLDYSDNLDLDNPSKIEYMTSYFDSETIGGKTYISAKFTSNSSQSAIAAQLVKSYLDFNSITGTVCSGTLTGMGYGYYLLESSVGNICALGTLVPASVGGAATLTLREKNLPGGIGGGGVEKESVPVGDGFEYTITITSPERGMNFSIHDYSTDIEIDPTSVSVAIDGGALKSGPTVSFPGEGFVIVGDDCPKDCNMHIRFSSTVELPAYTEIKVTYTATKIGPNPTNGATVNITDAEGGNVITPPTMIDPSTFLLQKVDGNTNSMIYGATFIAYKMDGLTPYYAKFNFNGAYTYSFGGWSKNESDATPIAAGACWINGLPEGTFYFEETDAPDGYIAAATPVTVVIEEVSNADIVTAVHGGTLDDYFGDTMIKVLNTPGNPLPETGGIGTTVFYVGGGILVLAALVILLTKKRNTAD